MATIERNHVKIDYALRGKGNITLLFVHGSFINKEYWNAQVSFFNSNYQVVAIDLAGHGKSGKNRDVWTIQEFGEDVITVIKELHLRNVILIGHSMGADAILEATVKYPEPLIGFVAVDFFKNPGTPLPEEIRKPLLEKLKSDFSDTSEAYARQGLLTPATDISITNRVVQAYRQADPDMGAKSIASLFTYYERERELMQQLKLKMHLVNVDYMPTNEDLLKKYAGSGYELLSLPGTCHFPMLEKPDELNRSLQQVIEEIDSSKKQRLTQNSVT